MVDAVDAATVMMIAPSADDPLVVLMQRRNVALEFVGGAYVFPGGKVDIADRSQEWEDYSQNFTDAHASRILGLGSGGLAHYIAAIRESFEEAGVLLGESRGDLGGSRTKLTDELTTLRDQLNGGSCTFLEVVRRLNLVLRCDLLHYFAHWVTPIGSPRRYDTRFFVAEVAVGSEGLPDLGEASTSVWISPRLALERYHNGEFELILPTIKNLEALGKFASYSEAVQSISQAQSVATIQPKLVKDSDGIRIVLPFDPEYEAVEDTILNEGDQLSLSPPAGTAID